MSDKRKDEKPPGYLNPLDLISMIFWGSIPDDDGDEVPERETMTSEEVMEYLHVKREQLTKWSDKGVLCPISRGIYDSETVRSFVPPSRRRGKINDT